MTISPMTRSTELMMVTMVAELNAPPVRLLTIMARPVTPPIAKLFGNLKK